MKHLHLIIIMIIFSRCVFSQDTAPAVEIFFITEGAPTSPIISCTLTAQSQCWDIEYPTPIQPGDYFLSDDYDNVIYVPTANNLGGLSAGFDFVAARGGAPGTGYPEYAYGLYKVTSNGTDKYFYLDYRDYRIGYYDLQTNGHPIDLWLKYV